jgi:hypothetical protein
MLGKADQEAALEDAEEDAKSEFLSLRDSALSAKFCGVGLA